MKVSDYIAAVLNDVGVEYVFGYQGANISHIIDSLSNRNNIKFIETYNEQGASFAANGYALISKKLGVAVASSGPGAINLLSGIANSYFDSIPCLFITGNVGLHGIKRNSEIRQNSFQELNIVSMSQGITKYSKMVDNADDIPEILEKCIHIAFDGRRGAVHIDIPHDIQKSEIAVNRSPQFDYTTKKISARGFSHKYLTSLNTAQKPLILIGGGAASILTKSELTSLVNKLNIPTVASLNGLTGLNASSKHHVGFIGDYGNRYANYAISYCDNLLVLGSRLDDRQIGGDIKKFAPEAKIFRIDVDEVEISRRNLHAENFCGDIKDFFYEIMHMPIESLSFNDWTKQIYNWKMKYPSYYENCDFVHVNTYFHYVSSHLKGNYIVCCDVGQNQMAAAQSFMITEKGQLLNSGGLGSMGFSLPAAIGAKYASPSSKIISINGDGGIQMNLQELQVIQREKLDINIIIVNNNCLGMIRQYQKLALSSRYNGSLIGYENPDFMKIANAYGFQYLKIENTENYKDSFNMIENDMPCIIEVSITNEIDLLPEMGIDILNQNPIINKEEV